MDYYEYNYGFEPGAGEVLGGALGAIFGFFFVFYLLIIAFGVVSYVLESLGMYTIAKRRGIRNPGSAGCRWATCGSWAAFLTSISMWQRVVSATAARS